MYEIKYYKNTSGESEITDYIRKLQNKKDKNSRIKYNKISSYIRMLSEKGLKLGEPYIKHLEDDIWELRPLRDRILFAYLKDNKFVLLHIFMKTTQKTPQREIEQAKRNLKDLLNRKSKL